MKIWKGIGLFLVYPAIMLGIGFIGGVVCTNYFYPGRVSVEQDNVFEAPSEDWQKAALENVQINDNMDSSGNQENNSDIVNEDADSGSRQSTQTLPDAQSNNFSSEQSSKSGVLSEELLKAAEDIQAAATMERLTVDTAYILEETDVRSLSVVETSWRLPDKYVGMDRDQFIEAMEEYEAFPPLSELERGFVSLEVLSFSREKVVVQMNYEYTQPSSSFFLKVENNFVVVYLDDQETIYMYTDVLLSELPDRVQQDIINVMYIPDEESLYDFLETYSS